MHARTLPQHNKDTETSRQWPLKCPKTGPVHKNSSLGSGEKLEKKKREIMNSLASQHQKRSSLCSFSLCLRATPMAQSVLPRVSWGAPYHSSGHFSISHRYSSIFSCNQQDGQFQPTMPFKHLFRVSQFCYPDSKVSTHPNNTVSNMKYFKLR